MKLHWLLIGSLVTTGLATSPSQAEGRLTSWQFTQNQKSNRSFPQWAEDAINQSQTAKVEAIDLVDNQLLVRSDGRLTATGEWDRVSGIYEMTIPNAELADPIRGPELERDSPISEIRVRQEDYDYVVIQIHVASGFHIEDQINQPSTNLLVISWREGSSQAERWGNQSSQNPYQSQTYETRRIELENFGIKMTIPKSFRAMATNDGAVQILDNETYEIIRCNQREPGLCVGRSYSALTIKLLSNSKNSDLHSKVGEIVNSNDCYSPPVTPFSLENLKGLKLITPPVICPASTAIAWFSVPDVGIIQMSIGGVDPTKEQKKELLNIYLNSVEYLK